MGRMYACVYACMDVCIYTFTLTRWLVYISDVIVSSHQKSKQAELGRQQMKIATCILTPSTLETLSQRSLCHACTNTPCPVQTLATKLKGLTSTERHIVPAELHEHETRLTVKD